MKYEMKASQLRQGAMFFHPDFPEVYIKVKNQVVQGRDASVFVKNSALARFGTFGTPLGISDYWTITDEYYESRKAMGKIIEVSDLTEAEEICFEKGLQLPDIFSEYKFD